MKNSNYASFFERLLSRFIDMSIYLMLVFLPFLRIPVATETNAFLDNFLSFILFTLFVSLLIFPLEIFMISKFGGTLGKLLMGLRIQKENGSFLNFKETFYRVTIGRAVSGLFFSLGYLWIFRNEKRQAWHDMISGTVVVRKIGVGWLIGLIVFTAFMVIDMVLFSGSIIALASRTGLLSEVFGV